MSLIDIGFGGNEDGDATGIEDDGKGAAEVGEALEDEKHEESRAFAKTKVSGDLLISCVVMHPKGGIFSCSTLTRWAWAVMSASQ